MPAQSPSDPPTMQARARRVMTSTAGAFDLPSIIVGVIVVAILAAGGHFS